MFLKNIRFIRNLYWVFVFLVFIVASIIPAILNPIHEFYMSKLMATKSWMSKYSNLISNTVSVFNVKAILPFLRYYVIKSHSYIE